MANKIVEETSFRKIKRALIDIKDHYPDGIVYGKLEYHFKGKKYVLDLLIDQGIFELIPKDQVKKLPIKDEEKKERWYRLTKRGIDLAISMINLDYSEKILKYANETKYFTEILIWLTRILIGFGAITICLIFIQILQNIVSS